jgi:acetoin utilization deacetylase AcuC-like enzyme
MGKALKEVADKYCQGRAVFVLEGGYDLKGLAGGVREVLEELLE